MRRRHWFEFEDQPWFPALLRDCMTDYLTQTVRLGGFAAHVAERLRPALESQATREIVDLGSGSGGAMPDVAKRFAEEGRSVHVVLTDRYPNHPALERVCAGRDDVAFRREPVDATRVPPELSGVRTLLLSFHHFRPEEARAILADAVRQRRAIAVFEGTENRLAALVPFVLTVPIMVLLLTPFLRPFRLSRLLLTYLLPLLPLLILWDGLVSNLRTYSVEELRGLTEGLGAGDYSWDIERTRLGPVAATSLVGTPNARPGARQD